MMQMTELLDDAREHSAMSIIAGDFSTGAHGLARLSPYYAGGIERIRSVAIGEVCDADSDAELSTIGLSESEAWVNDLWSESEINPGFHDPFPSDITTHSRLAGWVAGKVLHTLSLFACPALTTHCTV